MEIKINGRKEEIGGQGSHIEIKPSGKKETHLYIYTNSIVVETDELVKALEAIKSQQEKSGHNQRS